MQNCNFSDKFVSEAGLKILILSAGMDACHRFTFSDLSHKGINYNVGCLYIKEYSEELIKRIIEIVNKRIDFEKENPNKEFNWWESFKDIDFEIVDECITKNCIENWDDFIAKIHKINWE